MISICVPVYNFKIHQLIKSIESQITSFDFELVVIDDASDEEFRLENRKYIGGCNYIELSKNIGRSKIRNFFKSHVKYPYMLFLDCDSLIENQNFIHRYTECLEPNSVIYGGRVYPDILPDKNKLLSWKYGVLVESKTVNERNKEPYLSFMTNNFLIDRVLLERIPFNEAITGYGHEDTLFGYELAKNKVKIKHIENPVLNTDIEINERFFVKNEEAIRGLVKLKKQVNGSVFFDYVKLLRFYKGMNSFQIKAVLFLFYLFSCLVKRKMISGFYSNGLLNFYKLGYLIKTIKNE